MVELITPEKLAASGTEIGAQKADRIVLAQQSANTGRHHFIINVDNSSGVNKLGDWIGSAMGFAGYPVTIHGAGFWASTTPSQITEVNIIANGAAGQPTNTFGSGVRVTVFGR